MKLSFDSILPDDIRNYNGHLVLTTKSEAPVECEKPMLHEDIFEQHPTVIRGLMIQKLFLGYDEDLIIGVDPGQRIGCLYFILVEKLKVHSIHQLKN